MDECSIDEERRGGKQTVLYILVGQRVCQRRRSVVDSLWRAMLVYRYWYADDVVLTTVYGSEVR